jgi:hypothetical protein
MRPFDATTGDLGLVVPNVHPDPPGASVAVRRRAEHEINRPIRQGDPLRVAPQQEIAYFDPSLNSSKSARIC